VDGAAMPGLLAKASSTHGTSSAYFFANASP